MTRDEFEGFESDPGPDEEEEVEACEDGDCDECPACEEASASAAADLRAERRAEARAMACDLGVGPSDDWRD